jgi:hypothetical protein
LGVWEALTGIQELASSDRRQLGMKRALRVLAAASGLLIVCSVHPTLAQKPGGVLRVPHFNSPASMSLLEESTVAVNRPMMGVFNNLVMFGLEASTSFEVLVLDLKRVTRRGLGLDRAAPQASLLLEPIFGFGL